MENTTINDTRLSPHFKLGEFLNLSKYPDNKPTMQHVANKCTRGLSPCAHAHQTSEPLKK